MREKKPGINHKYLSYFKDSYKECRREFLSRGKKLSKLYKYVKQNKYKIPCKNNDDLNVDLCLVSNKKKPANHLVLITSGLHGIEGYAGSALQNLLMDELIKNPELLKENDILLVHALNPWGFKYNRRVSANNVDINRNFHVNPDFFKIQNKIYGKINHLINPSKKFSESIPTLIQFILIFLALIFRFSRKMLVQAVGEGQYEHEKGIIFGGKDFEYQRKIMDDIHDKIIKKYNHVFVIDLHTGLGKKGKLQVFTAPGVHDKRIIKLAEKLFNPHVFEGGYNQFYKEKGSFIGYMHEKSGKTKTCIPLVFEFGTYGANRISAIKSIRTIIIENQAFHIGLKNEKDRLRVQKSFKEMFYPSSISWRMQVTRQFHSSVLNLLNNINKGIIKNYYSKKPPKKWLCIFDFGFKRAS
ncbi:MAG: M14 family metallopeptidase [Bacteroidota bacterium]